MWLTQYAVWRREGAFSSGKLKGFIFSTKYVHLILKRRIERSAEYFPTDSLANSNFLTFDVSKKSIQNVLVF